MSAFLPRTALSPFIPQLLFGVSAVAAMAIWPDRRRVTLSPLAVLGGTFAFFVAVLACDAMLGGAPREPEFLSVRAIVIPLMVAPICEELFFRRVVLTSLIRDGFGHWPAVLYGALLFMAAHFSFYPGAFLLGSVTGTIYLRTGSLTACIAIHAVSNLIAVTAFSWFPALVQLADQVRILSWFVR